MRRSGVYSPSEGYLAWQKSEHQAGLFYGIATNFAFKQEVLLFGLKDWILDSWTKAKQESLKHGAPRDDAVTVGITMSTIPENIVKDLLYMCLGLRLFSENITLGSLHVVQSSIGNVYWNITNAHRVIDSALVSIRCIAAFVGAPDWVQEQNAAATRTVEYRPKAFREGEKRGMRIEARDLSFRYPTGKENALRNINLTVEPGETLAIVGFNGGGKSTLAKVLTGLYEYEGSLLIDGVEARTYQRESLHKFMTVCPQNFAVFPLSIRENIGLGEVKDIDDVPAIMQAVKKGGAEEVIRVHGLDKHLSGIGAPVMDPWGPPEPPQPPQPKDVPQVKNGEKNIAKESGSRLEAEKNSIELSKDETESLSKEPRSNGKPIDGSPPSPMAPQQPSEMQPLMRDYPVSVALSGGQMQRVAISRSFMRADEATLVVLDEPSASLDARAEYELFQRIYALSKGESNDTRTTIYISHRFSTVRRADKIAVVEEGAITEFGSHKELMELNGRYAELFNLQVKAFSE
ncbi:hypothetical protein FRC16_002363 [Serendipita sp. 398]|nr:hypothetical protein FRC16_002363 [Serendipita sp. 398]